MPYQIKKLNLPQKISVIEYNTPFHMANEAKTMELFRKLLRKKGYYKNSSITIEEQKSENKRIQRLLSAASKKQTGLNGYPDFIITCNKFPDTIIAVECKGDKKNHQSEKIDDPVHYAVDGVSLYSKFLSKDFDVIAIAISGFKEDDYILDNFIQVKGSNDFCTYFDSGKILKFEEYYEGVNSSNIKFNQDFSSLIAFSKEINEELQSRKIKESLRALLISGILISLKHERFKAEYKSYQNIKKLTTNLYSSICEVLDEYDIKKTNKDAVKNAYKFIKTHATINEKGKSGIEFLTNLIFECDQRINGFNVTHRFIDTVSQFYIEFLRYANNDKGLGIVLTPPHITHLFTRLAKINKDSVILDNCAGTGGFLVSSMKLMLSEANGVMTKEKAIKSNQLIGIEFDPEIYALLISNMIVHHDGNTHIYQGDCFKLSKNDKLEIQKLKPTVGLLNPPYKNKRKGKEEFEFILNNLSLLEKGSLCVAIIPMSCVLDTEGESYRLKKKLLSKHTLEAVLSLPEELFINSKVNTVTCAVVIKSGEPHPSGYKTWFAYCRNDGFVKKKNKGRIDANHKWEEIENKWVNAYINRDEIKEFSIKKEVSANMEWCAEAFLDADYDKICIEDYMDTVKNFFLFNLKSKESTCEQNEDAENGND